MAEISGDWLPVLQEEFRKPYYKQLYEFVKSEYSTRTIYPPAGDIFKPRPLVDSVCLAGGMKGVDHGGSRPESLRLVHV